ncbi:MAG: glycosyltransferase family 39 protein [Chitinophagaceae bacterium]|nr:glycosyltransferase family 39 protein [Chitinophagaceae bacterium]
MNRIAEYLFLILLLLFIFLKWPSLQIPYFWDELGVYVPGMREIADKHTIGIFPADLDPLYSRGHPMLFYFVGGNVFKLFGDHIMVGHVLAITIAVCTLLLFFRTLSRIFNPWSALAATFLLAVQPVFFAMSGILLPEMLLTFFGILAFSGIYFKQWGLFALGGTLALMTKESGIIWSALAAVVLLTDSLLLRDFFTLKRWSLFLKGALPLIVYGAFLLLQKYQHGWYFFPEHLGLMRFQLQSIGSASLNVLFLLLIDQGRWFLSIVVLAAIFFFRSTFFSGQFIRLLLIFLALLIISTVFCSVNYFVPRYQLYMYPFFIMLVAYAVGVIAKGFQSKGARLAWILVLSVTTILGIYNMNTHKFHDTYSMTYLTTVRCVQQCIGWVEKQSFAGTLKVDFPVEQAMEEKRNGYTQKSFQMIRGWDQKPDYHIAFYLDGQQSYDPWQFDSTVKRFDLEFAHIEVLTSKKSSGR